MNTFEIEIKSLLGEEENALKLKQKMLATDPNYKKVAESEQLNHYFEVDELTEQVAFNNLLKNVEMHFDSAELEELRTIIDTGENFSVRTREKDGQVLLVVKASLDEGSSANTVSRLEFEEEVKISLEELDQILLQSGFKYQAKWSRSREEFSYKGLNVCIDKNAGYGFLAEFEKVLTDESKITEVHAEIIALMQELDIKELPQDQLERMFAHYNQNWPDYYGTDKVFVIT